MASMKDIVEALGAAIAAMGDIQSKGYMLGKPTPPYAHVMPGGDAGDIDYDQAMHRGLDWCPFTVQVFSGSPVDRASQIRMLEYIEPSGARSIKAAIEADKTLGGLVDDLRVRVCTGYRQYVIEGHTAVLGATFYVDVMNGGGV